MDSGCCPTAGPGSPPTQPSRSSIRPGAGVFPPTYIATGGTSLPSRRKRRRKGQLARLPLRRVVQSKDLKAMGRIVAISVPQFPARTECRRPFHSRAGSYGNSPDREHRVSRLWVGKWELLGVFLRPPPQGPLSILYPSSTPACCYLCSPRPPLPAADLPSTEAWEGFLLFLIKKWTVAAGGGGRWRYICSQPFIPLPAFL